MVGSGLPFTGQPMIKLPPFWTAAERVCCLFMASLVILEYLMYSSSALLFRKASLKNLSKILGGTEKNNNVAMEKKVLG